MIWKLALQLMIVVLISCPIAAYSGTLSDFEKDATTSAPSSGSQPEQAEEDDESFEEELAEEAAEAAGQVIGFALGAALLAGTENTLMMTSDSSDYDTARQQNQIEKRERGDLILPNFRVKGNWQTISPGISGSDFSVDLGYSLFALQFRSTHLKEKPLNDSLRLTYLLLKYRLTYGNSFEIDLGIGRSELKGIHKNIGTAINIPITWEIIPNTYLEYAYAYSNFRNGTLSDHDVALTYSFWQGIAASAGYRSLSTPGSSLSGPYIGLSIIF